MFPFHHLCQAFLLFRREYASRLWWRTAIIPVVWVAEDDWKGELSLGGSLRPCLQEWKSVKALGSTFECHKEGEAKEMGTGGGAGGEEEEEQEEEEEDDDKEEEDNKDEEDEEEEDEDKEGEEGLEVTV